MNGSGTGVAAPDTTQEPDGDVEMQNGSSGSQNGSSHPLLLHDIDGNNRDDSLLDMGKFQYLDYILLLFYLFKFKRF